MMTFGKSDRAGNSLNSAYKLQFNDGKAILNDKISRQDDTDLYMLRIGQRSKFNAKFTKKKRSAKAKLDIFSLDKPFGKGIGSADFGKMKPKRWQKFLTREDKSQRKGKKKEVIKGLTLEPGTYYLRVNHKSGSTPYKLVLKNSPVPLPSPNPSSPPGPPSTSTHVPIPTPIPTPKPVTPWKAEYFNSIDPGQTPGLVQMFGDGSQNLRQVWGNSSPGDGIRADNFSARFTTTRSFSRGLHKITAKAADDGIRIFVDGEQVVNRWGYQDLRQDSGFFFSDGGTYPVVVEYQENKFSAGLDVQFSKAQPFVEKTDTGRYWSTDIFHVDPWNPSTQRPSARFFEQTERRVAVINLGSSTRASDGKKGIQFNANNGALRGQGNQLPQDNFAVRSHTKAYFEGGEYVFNVSGDDAFQLFAAQLNNAQTPTNLWYDISNGGRQIGDNAPTAWQQSYGPTEYKVTLPKGWHAIHFSYAEAGGDARFDLSWEKAGTFPKDPGYLYKDSDYLNALYQDNIANAFSRKVHGVTSAFDSDDSAPNGVDANGSVYALVGGEVIEAKNGKEVASNNWGYNGTVAIFNKELNKTFIYWHFAEGSINEGLQGKTLNAGDLIGIEGNTGNSSGNHTHVEVHEGRAYVDMSNPSIPRAPANSGRLDVATVFQDAVRKGLVKLYR